MRIWIKIKNPDIDSNSYATLYMTMALFKPARGNQSIMLLTYVDSHFEGMGSIKFSHFECINFTFYHQINSVYQIFINKR